MSVRIKEETFPAEYLTTPETQQKGMMGRDKLEGCMVFKMGNGHHSFWMHGCILPLDIIFVNKNIISRIHHNCPIPNGEPDLPKYTGIGDHVIEFNGGTALNKGWKVGDKVTMYLGTPQNPVR